ncbi:hypothetical protein H0H93_016406 [Arthromyces matolae]|nr:hypothetical protein H0H93_016406 [Arthromyces matolae]
MRQLPAYPRVLNILTKNPNALFLEIGCFFGVDIRKVVADGWPIENVVASDLRSEFWTCGHQLFKSTPETFPATFIPGDVFDPAIISPRKPFYTPEEPPRLEQPLSSLTSLTPLQGRFHVIHATNFFHLFDEAGQLQLARQLATLLSPTPGSMIIGLHTGSSKKGLQSGMEPVGVTATTLFAYSPETWETLWDGQVFEKGTVKVEGSLHAVAKKDVNDGSVGWSNLCWSVTRL